MAKAKDLNEITELEFEKGLVTIIRSYKSEINKVIELMNDVMLYKEYGYTVKYYFNSKNGTFNYQADKKGEIGFRKKDGISSKYNK